VHRNTVDPRSTESFRNTRWPAGEHCSAPVGEDLVGEDAARGVASLRVLRRQGGAEFPARVVHAYTDFVANSRYAVTCADDLDRHDDIATFTIQLTAPGGEVAWAARVFLFLDERGRIREDQLTVQPPAG
jgi:hypothetical protein